MRSSVRRRTVLPPRTRKADLKVRFYGLRSRGSRFRVVEADLQVRVRMHVANRDRQGIGCIVRCGRLRETKQHLDHLLHLTLLRAAVADDGAFHFGGCVLDDRAAGLDSREQRNAARVPQLERAARVDRVKHALDGDAVGPRLRVQRNELAVDTGKARGKCVSGSGGNGAAGHEAMTAAVRLHAAVAGAFGAGIDADNSHAREASISFSSMSKLAHTCCTSSWSSRASINFNMTEASLPVSFT